MSTCTCVHLCSSWRPRGHGLTLTRCSEDAAREGSSHTPEVGVFSTQASGASEAPTPPPPEPATPAASEATKLDSEIAEQRRQLESSNEELHLVVQRLESELDAARHRMETAEHAAASAAASAVETMELARDETSQAIRRERGVTPTPLPLSAHGTPLQA